MDHSTLFSCNKFYLQQQIQIWYELLKSLINYLVLHINKLSQPYRLVLSKSLRENVNQIPLRAQ